MAGKTKKKIKLSPKGKIAAYTVLVAVVIILIAITAAQKLGNVTVNTMINDMKTYVRSMGSGDGFPYSTGGSSVLGITVNNSNVLLLEENETKLLSPTAKNIATMGHNYSSPAIKTNHGVSLVYDLDSGKYRLQNSSEITFEGEADKQIMAAAVSKKGSYALGTYGDNVQSVLTVYNGKNKEKFIWNFKSERISDISLSDGDNKAAVTTLYTDNGKISSKLYIFNFKSSKYEQCFDYPSTVLLKVDYITQNDIVALGDNLRSYIKNEKTRTDIKFDSDNIRSYSVSDDGFSALAFSKYGGTSISNVKLYNEKNKEKFSVEFEKDVKWVDCDGKYTAVLFEDEIKTYNKRGKEIGSISFSGEPSKLVVDGGTVYLVTSANIQSFKTRGNHAEASAK